MTKAERNLMLQQFADKIKSIRYLTGNHNRRKLAEKIDISYDSLALYEKGPEHSKPNKQLPPFDVVIQLAMACNMDINEFVPGVFTVPRSERGPIFKTYLHNTLESYFDFACENECLVVALYCMKLYQRKMEAKKHAEKELARA